MSIPGWTAVIVNYNGAGYLEACLLALGRVRVPPQDIVVVDNASTDDSLQELHSFPRVNVLAQARNLGFAGGANAGLGAVETGIAVVLNPDVELDPDYGARLMTAFDGDARLGAAGALLRFPDTDRIQHAGGAIERPLLTTRHLLYGEPLSRAPSAPLDVDFVTGGAMALRLAALRESGGFDEAFVPVYYEDVDLCARLRDAGWSVRLHPELTAAHHEGVTLERSDDYHRFLHRNRIRFALTHLTPKEWRASFVPAELARLRHELHALEDESWAARSGADAIEALLRGAGDTDSLVIGPPPAILAGRIAGAAARAETPEPPHPAGARRYIDALLRRIDPLRRQIEVALAEQREFNAAVVFALEAQDALNREQTALTLLLALDVLGELRRRNAPPESR